MEEGEAGGGGEGGGGFGEGIVVWGFDCFDMHGWLLLGVDEVGMDGVRLTDGWREDGRC